VPLRSISVDRGTGARRGHRLAALVRDELGRPFDLARTPLFHALIVRLGPLDHVLGLVLPHTIWDSACRPLFAREFAAAYDAVSVGQPMPPAPEIQLGDFAHWQRTHRGGVARAYWERQLAGARVHLGLTACEQPGYRLCELQLPAIGRTLSGRLHDVSSRASGMPAMTLTAATAVLLSAHAGRDDVTVALMHSNRSRRETRNLLGFLADVIPLRVSVQRHESFRSTVRQVVDVTRAAFGNLLPSGAIEDLLPSPPEVMVNPQQLAPATSLSTVSELRIGDYRPQRSWTMHPTRAVWYRAPIDIDFRIAGRRAIAPTVSYNALALAHSTGQRLASDLGAILERVALSPDRPLHRLL
jgi:hypothetical protein